MNKIEIVTKIVAEADISQASAVRALNALISSITDELKQNGSVNLVGFGTFAVKERTARTGRNPKTGETIQIAASKSVTFKSGKALKDACN
jgi:DNA-binding protein HU-beta